MPDTAFADPPFADEPFSLFSLWFDAAAEAEPNDPDAVALATVDASGMPDVRMVLLRGRGPEGFVFYTNAQSAKGLELRANPCAALCLHWKSLRRQIRVRGPVAPVSDFESDGYFNSRSRASRISAIASQQSRPIADRATLEAQAEDAGRRVGSGDPARPPHWGGWRLTPLEIEFWRDGADRLHDRVRYRRAAPGSAWSADRLQP